MIRELETALDTLALRQRTVAANLANINTPGYTRRDVDFHGHMQAVLAGQAGAAEVTEDKTSSERLDGNNVTLEKEMLALSETELMYQAASQFLTGALARLRYVATDGRG